MDLYIRPLTDNDYNDTLVHWWNDWGWDAPSKDFLPNDGVGGFMVLDSEHTPICAGYMYITNSKVSWVDWIISSKTYRKKPHRKNAIKMLIEGLTEVCRNSGAKYIYALIKHRGLIETYKHLGYVQGDSYTTEMIKKL
jgi:hypothetical protein